MTRSPFSARAFFRDPLAYVRAEPDGATVARFTAGRSRYVLLRDPAAIWQVLVTDGSDYRPGKWKRRARRYVGDTLNTLHGDAHRERRRALQPSVGRARISAQAPAIADRAARASASLRPGEPVRLRALLDPLALTMAGDVLLSTDLRPGAGPLAGALAEVMAGVPRLTPPVRGTRGGRARAQVDAVLAPLVAQRRAAGVRTDGDLLDALLAAGLPDAVVRGELLAFLLAAADEPTSALEAVFWLLARNPGVEARLHAELDEVLGGRPPAPEDVARLPYLDAVLRETLRLFPPARHIDRCPAHDVRIGEEAVRAGTNVLISPFVTHHDPRLHGGDEHAARFAPERFLDGRRGRPRGTYVPFGAGVHTCIGEPLARAIMSLTLAALAQRWRLVVAADAPAPVPSAPRLVVRPEAR